MAGAVAHRLPPSSLVPGKGSSVSTMPLARSSPPSQGGT